MPRHCLHLFEKTILSAKSACRRKFIKIHDVCPSLRHPLPSLQRIPQEIYCHIMQNRVTNLCLLVELDDQSIMLSRTSWMTTHRFCMAFFVSSFSKFTAREEHQKAYLIANGVISFHDSGFVGLLLMIVDVVRLTVTSFVSRTHSSLRT